MVNAHLHTVLVVDDNADVRDAITMLLALNGMRAHAAGDGREALDALQHGTLRPCFIVLDVHMPRMDGIEFRRAQQADRALRDIPVVALSAFPRLHALMKPLAVAAAVEKPIDPEQLIALIREHCRVRPGRSRAS
jgi:CheY-like chemotaxis protein